MEVYEVSEGGCTDVGGEFHHRQGVSFMCFLVQIPKCFAGWNSMQEMVMLMSINVFNACL